MDLLNVIESKDLVKKERVELEDKKLDQLTLPEHARLLNEMQSFIEESEELTDDERRVIDKINISSEKKVMAWAYVINQIKEAQEINVHSMKYHEEKIKLLKMRNTTLQNRIDNRMDRIDELMKLAGKTKIEGANSTVVYRKMPEKLKWLKQPEEVDQNQYVGMFTIEPSFIKWDNSELKKHMKTVKDKKNDDFLIYREPDKLEIK
jgi:hypothetical protein